MEENKFCEECKETKEDVRFEGLVEKNICDSCLYKIKNEKNKI